MLTSLMSLVPRALRRSMVFSRMHIDHELLADVSVKLVETAEEALAAAALVHDAYVKRGILAPHPTQVHLSSHSAAPSAWVFIATHRGRVVGTISLVECAGELPLDQVFRAEMDVFRGRGEHLAECGALAVAPEFRHSGIVFWLNRIMTHTALARGVDRIVIAVHPNAQDFYREALLFQREGPERSYPGLNKSARAIALTLPLGTIESDYSKEFDHLGPCPQNARWLYFEADIPQIQQPTNLDPFASDRRFLRKVITRARPDVVAIRQSLASYTELTATTVEHLS